jgi:cell division septum initiation protein DivIVA
LPLTKNAIVDREAALNLIDELRVAVPEEVRAAKRINTEGERIIEKAQEEAERIVARAQEQAAFLIGERGLTEAAEAESRRIIATAEDDADDVRHGADDYAAGVLQALQTEVERTLRGIDRGIAMLDDRRAAYAPPAPEPEPEPVADAPHPDDPIDDEGLANLARR